MQNDAVICERCGEEFATKEAHDIHHAEKHGGNISTITAPVDETDHPK